MKTTVYSPESGIRNLGLLLYNIFENFRHARELGVRMFLRDIRASYREFFLGFFWAITKPLGLILPFAVLEQQKVLNVDTGNVPPFVYMLICNTFWFVFVDTLTATRGLATTSMAILSKVKFAVEALFLSGVLKVLFNLLLQLIAVIAAMIWFKISFEPKMVLVIIPVMSLILAGSVLGFLLMPVVTLIKDLNNLVATLVSLLFFATPIIYPVSLEGVLGTVARYNPITPLIITAKQCMTGDEFTMLPQFGWVTLGCCLLIVFGLVLQRVSLPILVERMNA